MAWIRSNKKCTGTVIDNANSLNNMPQQALNIPQAYAFLASLKNIRFTGVPIDVTDILVAWWENNLVVVFLQNNTQWQYDSGGTIIAQNAYMVKLTSIITTQTDVAVSYQKAFNNTGKTASDHPIANTYDLVFNGSTLFPANITLSDINYIT